MAHHFDTVIIGAGPAGSACAITLKKLGVSCCVIDRAIFPRNKTCAGLVTAKSYKLINTLFDSKLPGSLFCAESSTVRLFGKTKLIAEAPITNGVRLVNRRDFDNALVSRYRGLGGTFFEGESILRIDHRSNRLKLKSGKSIEYKTLIFADGALSMAHKKLNIPREKLAFGVEAYVPSDQLNTDGVDLYFEYIDDGYIWVFPHGDTVCAGVAGTYDRKINYKDILSKFLKDMGVDPGKQKYIGAFLPYGYVVPQGKLPDNVMLIGDAAGFTDPISGEGLYMAMRSGIDAANAAVTSAPKKNYLNSVKPLSQLVRDGKKVQKLFYTPAVHKRILEKAQGKSKFISFFFDNIVEDYVYTYRQIVKLRRDHKNKRSKK